VFTEDYRKARMGKYLFDEFPVHIYLKKDALSPWDGPREAAWTGIEWDTSNFRCMLTMLSCLEKSYSPYRKKKRKARDIY
jgi:hypothetical protein